MHWTRFCALEWQGVCNVKYTVVIPAHNAAKFLASALESVRSQRLLPEVVIVVDDGSNDGTAGIAASYGAIVISNVTARGPSAARNAGVAASSTELVAFLDADDEWTPEHAEQTVGALVRPGVVFSAAPATQIGAESGKVPVAEIGLDPLDLREMLMFENPIIQSGVVIRRDAFDSVGGYDESMRFAEDYDLWNRVAEVGLFCPVRISSVRRRIHDDQLTMRFGPKMLAGAWDVRRRTAARRLLSLNEFEYAGMVGLLCKAARREIAWAVWTGVPDYLSLVREELETTDDQLQLRGVLAAEGGSSLLLKRFSQDVRCRAYDVRARLRRRRGPSGT